MKILIIDDDDTSRTRLSGFLDERNQDVTACASFEKAKTVVEQEFFPMMMLDFSSSNLQCIEFCSWVRSKKDGDLHYILFLASKTEQDTLKILLDAGASDCIQKSHAFDSGVMDIRLAIGQKQIKQITEQKHLGVQLKKERDLISRAFEVSPALIIFLDANGHILSFNRACRELTGYTLEDVQGKVYWELPFCHSEKEAYSKAFHASTSAMRPYLKEGNWTTRDGKARFVSWSFSDVFDDSGKLELTIGAGINVTERREAERRLAYMAEHDSLTDLFNRSKLGVLLERALESARNGTPTALLYIDLDKFKNVNDIAGHGAGDRLIIKIAALLKEVSRVEDVIIRFGGDEFIVILDRATLEEAREIAERYRSQFDNFLFEDSGKTFNISTSIGLAIVDGTKTSEELIASVDLSCYTAKARGRNRVEIHNNDQTDFSRAVEDAEWSKRIKETIRNHGLELWFQPVTHIASGEIHFHEVLLRLSDEPAMSPYVFLGAMERSGSIASLDRHVIELAAKALVANPGALLSVNISGQSANDDSFFQHVIEVFERHDVAFNRVIFEVTETALMYEPEKARILFDKLKAKGFRFALDDFGAGFSSLGYLRHLPVEILKVDGGFIKDLGQQPLNQALVQSINQTAHILQLQTVAEFVEDEETFKLIEHFGFDYAQGFFLGKPSRDMVTARQSPIESQLVQGNTD